MIAAAVPRVAASSKPEFGEAFAPASTASGLWRSLTLMNTVPFIGQRRAGAELRFRERLAEVLADAHHFAGRAHFRPERRIDARELIEREHGRFHEELRRGQHAIVRLADQIA